MKPKRCGVFGQVNMFLRFLHLYNFFIFEIENKITYDKSVARQHICSGMFSIAQPMDHNGKDINVCDMFVETNQNALNEAVESDNLFCQNWVCHNLI